MYQNVHFKKDMVKGHQAIPFLLNDATDLYQLFLLDTNRMVLGIIYNSNNGIMPITALQIVFVFSIILIVFYHYFIAINAFIFLVYILLDVIVIAFLFVITPQHCQKRIVEWQVDHQRVAARDWQVVARAGRKAANHQRAARMVGRI